MAHIRKVGHVFKFIVRNPSLCKITSFSQCFSTLENYQVNFNSNIRLMVRKMASDIGQKLP